MIAELDRRGVPLGSCVRVQRILTSARVTRNGLRHLLLAVNEEGGEVTLAASTLKLVRALNGRPRIPAISLVKLGPILAAVEERLEQSALAVQAG